MARGFAASALFSTLLALARGSPSDARQLALAAQSGAHGPAALRRWAERLEQHALERASRQELRRSSHALALSGIIDASAAPKALLLDLERRGVFEPSGDGYALCRPPPLPELVDALGAGAWQRLNRELCRNDPPAMVTDAETARSLGLHLAQRLAATDVAGVIAGLASARDAVERWPRAFAPVRDEAARQPAVYELELALAGIELEAGEPARALARLPLARRLDPRGSAAGEIHALAGKAYAALGQTKRAIRWLERARQEAASVESQGQIAHALASAFSKQGANREALSVASAAAEVARPRERADLFCDAAQAASFLGEAAESEALLARAERCFAELDPGLGGLGRARTRYAAVEGLIALRAGNVERAERAYGRMLELALEHRLDDLVALAGLNHGAACHQNGTWSKSLEAYLRALDAARARGFPSAEARASYNLGVLHFELGQTDLAEVELSRGLQIAERENLPLIVGSSLLVLGEVATRRGELAAARERFERAERVLQSCNARRELGELRVESATVALASGELARAQADVENAGRLADEVQADDLAARVAGARSLLWLERGRAGDALREAERGIELAERCRHALLGSKLSVLAARAARAQGSPALAERHQRRACELWERLTVGLPEPVRRLAAPEPPLGAPPSREDLDPDFRRVLSIYRRLSTAETPHEVLRETLDAAIELTGAERGFLIVVENRGGARVLATPVARNIDREALVAPQHEFSRSIAESVLKSGEPLLTVDAERDPRLADQRSVRALQLRSVLCVPIVSARGVLGSIYLDNRIRAGGFGPRETELCVSCADQAALALEKTRLLEDLALRTRALETERERVARLVEEREREIAELEHELEKQREAAPPRGIVGSSPALRRVFALIERVATTDISVLVSGESGTGKELVARAIHDKSTRANGPFLAINCGAVPEALLEAELFGYRKGAFTGASQDREGLFVAARGGSVFLDELGEMPPAMQVKLLRVLQEHEVKPLGSERSMPVDVRVICATNRNLRSEVAAGRFREDLFYRVAVVELALPALRERKEDLPALATALLQRLSGELGRPPPRLGAEALRALLKHSWPGNVRELGNVLARAAVLCEGGSIGPGDLGLASPSATGAPRRRPLDKLSLEAALRDSGMNAARAARSLGIGRATLYRHLARAGIDRASLLEEA
ncbi:MAG: sigma 54-interacting transcriptional regulator [Polyangiaceae bacterium]